MYVLQKIKIILFPFLLREDDWKAGQSNFSNYDNIGDVSTDEDGRFAPKNDLQAPDLYIPVMSFITFLLIVGLYHGGKDEFDADNFQYVFSKSLFIWIFEACVQKGLFICFNFGNPSYCDLMAYTGYKFVVLCLVMLATVFGNA